jgi:hypothetical protein
MAAVVLFGDAVMAIVPAVVRNYITAYNNLDMTG